MSRLAPGQVQESRETVPTISPEEAWERIAARLAPLAREHVARRAAAGRVLAEALAAGFRPYLYR